MGKVAWGLNRMIRIFRWNSDYTKCMTKKNVLRVLPLAVLTVILIYTWILFSISVDYYPTLRHILGLIAVSLNLVLYFFRFGKAVVLTGLILLAATFNLLAFFPDIDYASFFINIGELQIWTPSIQYKSLLLLIFYCLINFKFLLNLYLDYKESRGQ